MGIAAAPPHRALPAPLLPCARGPINHPKQEVVPWPLRTHRPSKELCCLNSWSQTVNPGYIKFWGVACFNFKIPHLGRINQVWDNRTLLKGMWAPIKWQLHLLNPRTFAEWPQTHCWHQVWSCNSVVIATRPYPVTHWESVSCTSSTARGSSSVWAGRCRQTSEHFGAFADLPWARCW